MKTSERARGSIDPALIRVKVLEAIRFRPDTCDMLEIRLDMSHQTCSARLHELQKMGLISDSRERRPTRTGREAIVWAVREATWAE